MLKRGTSGPQVIELQKALLSLGYPLPRFGADGSLGQETLDAVNRLLEQHGKNFDEDKQSVSEKEAKYVLSLLNTPLPNFPEGLCDLRAKGSRNNIIRRRPWSDVTGICLHNTACLLGENPDRWSGSGKWEGNGSLGAHLGTTRGGKIMWIYDFDFAVIHANGFNNKTVGIEMDGHYCGVDGDLKTYWRPEDQPNRMPLTPTPQLVEATKRTVRWICQVVASHGGKIEFLLAHRQSSKDRRSDPGSKLWQEVALPLMDELKLSDGGEKFCIGSGYPIPEAWDARHKGVRY